MSSSLRDRLQRLTPAALSVLFLGGLAAYLWGHRAHISATYSFRPVTLGAIAAITALTLALRAAANQQLFGRLGTAAPWREWFGIVSVNSLSNYLPLSAGLVAKAFYLKRVHGLPFAGFAVGQSVLLILVVAANGAMGLLTVSFWRPAAAAWIGLAFAAMVAVGSLLWLPDRITRSLTGRWLPTDPTAIARLRGCTPTVIPLQAATLLTTAACLSLAFSMGHAEVSFGACIVFSAATVLTRVLSVTPGALGVREFLIGGLAVATGFELQDAVIAASAVRVAEVGVIFALGGAFSYELSKRVTSTFDREQ
jgi:uncharacterized membrane protein YbhN (UPF0104 family)